MERIRLELISIDLEKKRRNWDLYLVITTENPDNSGEMVMTILPRDNIIPLRKPADNFISFRPSGVATEGLSVLERLIPNDRSLKVQLWLMHSRQTARTIGDIMSEYQSNEITKSLSGALTSLGNINPWISLTLGTFGAIGNIMSKMKDKILGYVSLDEYFEEDLNEDHFDRTKQLSTGFGKIKWTWIIKH